MKDNIYVHNFINNHDENKLLYFFIYFINLVKIKG